MKTPEQQIKELEAMILETKFEILRKNWKRSIEILKQQVK